LVIPEGIATSVFPRVKRRLSEVGVSFDLWQQGFGTVALGCGPDGKFAASVGGVAASIPRQVGKTFTVFNILVGLALEFPGLRVAWTSHHNRTTTNTFRACQGMVKRKAVAPHLAAGGGIRTANGEQEIVFRNGSIIMFGAREHGFGRGLDEIDVEVFDEAQILTLKALEDMVPATNQARNPHGGLIFFLGTPPRPTDAGEAFTVKREQAISGKSKTIFYVEFGADPDSEPDDRSQWPKMNPSYPLRTPLESMLRMRENIPDEDSWNRESRGIWPEVSRHSAIVPAGLWRDLAASGPPENLEPTALGVDMSHGREISISGCWLRDGFPAHVEELWVGMDVTAATDFITAVAGRNLEVVIDDISPASQLVPDLRARRVKVRRSTARDMAKGCLLFETRATSETLTHAGQKRVTDAVLGGRKRPISDAGGWGWDRRDSTVTIHPAVSVTLALLGAAYVGEPSSGEAFFL
jgi:hypothetical protein